jgi:uncharacterized lipoprotein YehR (DUF1307 family)
MKKVISLILVVSMIFALSACGGSEPEFDPEDAFRDEVNGAVIAYCALSYQNVKTANTYLSDITIDGNKYIGKGKVTIRDAYGDTYVGKITAEYRYNEDTKSFSKVKLDIEQPKKQ